MIPEYLMDNYYAKTNRMDIVPSLQQIKQAILNHPDKIIIVRDGKIKGISFYFKLTDATYQRLETLDIRDIEVLKSMAQENGENFYFVLMVADGYKTMRIMHSRLLKLKPKTFSWWNPDMNKLHKYEVKICRS